MREKMSLQTRRELLHTTRKVYRQASWKERQTILDGFLAATGYKRKYAITLLNLETEEKQRKEIKCKKPKYGQAVQKALVTVWNAANQICSKRLIPFLPELVNILEKRGHLSLTTEIKKQLLAISASTMDRLLTPERQITKKGISTTKSSGLLKRQIKVRTFADWDDAVVDFFEADLVAHCGDRVEGTFLNTLVLTDIVSGWTEFLPLIQKSEADVIRALEAAMKLLPFTVLGLDTDNGSEFINYGLLKFCEDHQITFTRSRAYRKNDQAHVEEKNGSIVRRTIGYDRYEGTEAWKSLAKLYSVLRLYVNFFQPSLKLLFKERRGSKTIKKYEKAKTPYQRLLDKKEASKETKKLLKSQYEKLDPINLLKIVEETQNEFWQYAWQLPDESSKVKETISEKELSESEENKETKAKPIKEISVRRYRKTKKPRKPVGERSWRTRPDPFANCWKHVQLKLELNPYQTAKSLLTELIEKFPENLSKKHLRTLQRRVAVWRKEQSDIATNYNVMMQMQDNIAIRGE